MADERIILRVTPREIVAPAPKQVLLPPVHTPAVVKGARIANSVLENPLSAFSTGQYGRQHENGRKSARTLRAWSLTNEWVRIAINRRKRQISQARWHVVRTDDPQKPPNPAVVNAVMDLIGHPNALNESFRSLLDKLLEDLLVLDAGCCELVRKVNPRRGGDGTGGPVAELYALDGAQIEPDGRWDGTDQNAVRYRQVIDGKVVAEFRNQDLMYMMATPRTYSSLGWSPVETAVRSIEADLYGDDFDYEMLRQTQPQGVLYMSGADDPTVAQFREYWQTEIEGRRKLAITGSSSPDGDDDLKFVNMRLGPEDVGREKYRTWTATKIAAAFELDLGVFNLTANLHKDTGGHQQALTDEGHKALGKLVEEYLSAEVVSSFDEDHGLRIEDLNARDAGSQLELDKGYVALGALTPNEIRAEQGLDPVEWGDVPFIPGKGPWSGDSSTGQRPDDYADPNLEPDPGATPPDAPNADGREPNAGSGDDGGDNGKKPDNPPKKPSGGGKAANPFGTRRMGLARPSPRSPVGQIPPTPLPTSP